MANKNVCFIKVALQATYDALTNKDANSLYFVQETNRFYHADRLMGTGALVGEKLAGLMSPEDKAKLDALVKGSGLSSLTAVDGTINLTDAEDGGKVISVAIAEKEGNALEAVEGGLFVPAVDLTATTDKLAAVEKSVTQLQKDIVGGIRYKGAVATENDLPTDAKQGDLYEVTADGTEWCYNGTEWFEYGSAHFTPVAGAGIQINGNEIAVNIAEESHGLVAIDGALSINLATAESDGAMSAADKAALDTLIALRIAENYATKEEMQTISEKVTSVEDSYTWGEM